MNQFFHGVLDLWSGGQLLAFSALDGVTAYRSGLCLRTMRGAVGFEVVLPAVALLRFGEGKCESLFLSGDCFEFVLAGVKRRGAFVDAHHLLIEGDVQVTKPSAGLHILRTGNRTLLGVAAQFDQTHATANLDAVIEARVEWLRSQSTKHVVPEKSRPAFAKALSICKTQVCSPEGTIRRRWTTPDRWPHRDMWLWDTAFHAIGWRHLDLPLAREIFEAIFDSQLADGMIPHQSNPSHSSGITQPPVLTLAASLLGADDLGWLRRIFPKLRAYLQWDLDHRDSDGAGLLEWYIENDVNCRSGESGMDNSSRFDEAVQLDAVDFNSFAAHEAELLAQFADALGEPVESAHWREVHKELCALINDRLWNERLGIYVDCHSHSGAQSDVLCSAGFLPLLCGAASPAQAARLAAHLRDPATFGYGFPVASISKNQPQFYSKDMWRGPTWINLNWLIATGFARYGHEELAQQLRENTIAEIERQHAIFGTFFEYYDDEAAVSPPELLRKGTCDPKNPMRQALHDYGWSATLYIDLALGNSAQ